MNVSSRSRLLFVLGSVALLSACSEPPPATDSGSADAAGQVTASGFEAGAGQPAEPAAAPATPEPAAAAAVTLLAATLGDRACYLSLDDGSGAPRERMADMALCERTELVGQRVRLTVGSGQVAAESCQGDPECREQETVELVTAIEPIGDSAETAPARD